jgi:F-type H+-transporting ATPase subunit delta
MSDETVAQRYGRAIFELGVEGSNLEVLRDDMRKLAEAYKESPEMHRMMGNPLIPEDTRLAAVREIAERLGLSPIGTNAAGVLTHRKRISALPAIVDELDRLSDEKAGIVRATVSSAEPLSEAYAERLSQELSTATGKQVVLDRKHEPELLAGLVVRIGDQVIDGSARARLSELMTQLLSA